MTIGKNAFSANGKLASININAGANIASVGERAFANCVSLTEIDFDDGAIIDHIGAYAFAYCTGIESVVMHATTTAVDSYAFAGCESLKSLSFAPNGKMISFGDYVFNDCVRLSKINIPANLNEFQSSVFAGCTAITEIVVDPANENLKTVDGVLYNYNLTAIKFYPMGKDGDLTKLPWDTLTTIESDVFKGNPNIKKVKIGAKITSIGNGAFENCINLKDISFVNGITALSVGDSAFRGCVSLTKIDLPDTTESIGAYAFYMSELSAFVIPENVRYIGDYAFAYTKLTAITIPAKVQTVGNGAFARCTALASVVMEAGNVPMSLGTAGNTSADGGVFAGTAITAVSIPDRVTVIGGYAFYGIEALATVTVSETSAITEIGAYAFGETSIGSITLSQSLVSIGDHAFSGAKINAVTIPKSVETIGKYAFASTPLSSIRFEENGVAPLEIKDYAFQNTAFTTITLPSRISVIASDYKVSSNFYIKGIFTVFEGNKVLSAINVEEGNALLASRDGILYSINADGAPEELLYCPVGKTGSVVIPKTVVFVHNHAFYETSLTSISFEEFDKPANEDEAAESNYAKPLLTIGQSSTSVSNIAAAVFYGHNLESIRFPSHLTALNVNAVFSGNDSTSLKHVIFNPDSTVAINYRAMGTNPGLTSLALPKVSAIGQYAFASNTGVTSVTFAEGSTVSSISNYAFYNMKSLQSIEIPKSVQTIGNFAFQNSALTSVIFDEASELHTIGNSVFAGTPMTSFTFPASVESVGYNTFNTCANLEEVTLSERMSAVVK